MINPFKSFTPAAPDTNEIERRLTRIESRLCRLMLHLGLDPRTNEPLAPTKDARHERD